jgi:hypothetical protein
MRLLADGAGTEAKRQWVTSRQWLGIETSNRNGVGRLMRSWRVSERKAKAKVEQKMPLEAVGLLNRVASQWVAGLTLGMGSMGKRKQK